jgi:restriction endonuclease Mrr
MSVLMAIPRSDDLMLPLLRFAQRGPFRNSDAVEHLAIEFQLIPEERAEVYSRSRRPKFPNLIHWASGQLGMAKLLDKENSLYKITNRGLEVLKNPPAVFDRKFLATNFPEYAQPHEKLSAKTAQERPSEPDILLDAGTPDDRIDAALNDLEAA